MGDKIYTLKEMREKNLVGKNNNININEDNFDISNDEFEYIKDKINNGETVTLRQLKAYKLYLENIKDSNSKKYIK